MGPSIRLNPSWQDQVCCPPLYPSKWVPQSDFIPLDKTKFVAHVSTPRNGSIHQIPLDKTKLVAKFRTPWDGNPFISFDPSWQDNVCCPLFVAIPYVPLEMDPSIRVDPSRQDYVCCKLLYPSRLAPYQSLSLLTRPSLLHNSVSLEMEFLHQN